MVDAGLQADRLEAVPPAVARGDLGVPYGLAGEFAETILHALKWPEHVAVIAGTQEEVAIWGLGNEIHEPLTDEVGVDRE